MAEIKVAELPVMIESDFTNNDRFMVIDDGKARQLPLNVFKSWLVANVQGIQGEQGATGGDGLNGKDGINGKDGKDGLSAYQVAVSLGFVGTQAQWVASLKGVAGAKGADGGLGWTPVLRTVARDVDIVLELSDWVGGTGTKPITLGYIGSTGIVTNIANAYNIRGSKGDKGDTGNTGLTGASGASGVDGKTVTGIVIGNDLSTTINFSDATSVKSNTPPQQRGWATYKDGEFKVATTFTIPLSTQVVLPNNAIEKIENLPQGVSTLYNTVSQKYIISDIKGFYNIRVRFKAVASATPSFINLSMSKDTTEIPYSEDRALRGDSTIQDLSFSTELYGDAALAANGLTIRIKTYDREVSIYNIEVMIAKVI